MSITHITQRTKKSDVVELAWVSDKKLRLQAIEDQRQASVLQQRIRTALSTPAPEWKRNRDRGRVDPRALAKLATGTSSNVFRRRTMGEDIDTAVALSVDLSSSIAGSLPLIWYVSLTVNEALGRLGIPFMVSGWAGDERTTKIKVAKTWDAPYNAEQTKLNLTSYQLGGGTPTAGGFGWALGEIAKRPERRKVLFVLTDGSPSVAPGSLAYLQNKLDEAAAMGIEVVPVALGGHAVTAFEMTPIFRRDRVINVPDIATLRRTFADALVRELHRNRREVASVSGEQPTFPKAHCATCNKITDSDPFGKYCSICWKPRK